MAGAVLTLTSNNPAVKTRRMVVLARKLTDEETRHLDSIFDAPGGQMRYETLGDNFAHREQDLVDQIEGEQKKTTALTAYAVPSNSCSHSAVAIIVTVCAILNIPCVILQYEGDRLDSVEVLYNKQRYVRSTSVQQALSAGG